MHANRDEFKYFSRQPKLPEAVAELALVKDGLDDSLGIILRAGTGGMVVISSVVPRGVAAIGGLRVGDALLALDDVPLENCCCEVVSETVQRAWRSAPTGSALLFRVRRGGRGHGGRYYSNTRLLWEEHG